MLCNKDLPSYSGLTLAYTAVQASLKVCELSASASQGTEIIGRPEIIDQPWFNKSVSMFSLFLYKNLSM